MCSNYTDPWDCCGCWRCLQRDEEYKKTIVVKPAEYIRAISQELTDEEKSKGFVCCVCARPATHINRYHAILGGVSYWRQSMCCVKCFIDHRIKHCKDDSL